MQNEIWKPVVGYEGLYEISSYGNVRSLDRFINVRGHIHKRKSRPMKVCCGRYKMIRLSKDSKVYTVNIHRLIADAFIPNPQNKPQVNHINGVKTDNRIENLEWVTCSANIQHAYDNGLKKAVNGSRHYLSKLTDEIVSDIKRRIRNKEQIQSISNHYGVHQSSISKIKSGVTWKHVQ